MATLNDWEVVDANNNATPPDGWPENTMNYSDVNNTGRAVQGTMKRFFADINGSLAAGGAADAYTLTLNEVGYTAYFNGMIFACSIPATNLTTSPTMDVNGIGAANILDRNGNALSIGELVSGGIYEFRHDGTDLRVVGSGDVAGLDTQLQYNNAGQFGATVGVTFDNVGNELTLDNPVNVVTDIAFFEQADHASTVAGGRGYLWVRDDTPSILVFTDDQGTDTQLGTVGTTLPGGVDTNVQYNDGGVFGGTILNYNDADDQFSMIDTTLTTNAVGMMSFEADNLISGRMLSLEAGSGGSHSTGNMIFCFLNSTLGGSIQFGAAFRADVNNDSNAFLARMLDDGYAFQAYTNSTNRSRSLVYFESDATSPGQPVLEIQNDATDNLSPSIALNGDVGGIQFNNTNFSTDPNTLDWYEEGTTTAYIDTNSFGDGQSDGQTYGANNNVWYTRIGRIVFIQGRLQTTSIGSLSGSPIFIVFDPQLPWLFGEATNYHFGISDSSSLSKGADHSVNGYFSGLSSAIALEISDANTGHTLMTAAQLSNNSDLFFTGWYQVNSA